MINSNTCFFLALLLVASTTFASPRQAVIQSKFKPKSGCLACAENAKLSAQFKRLSYKISVDQEKGTDLIVAVIARVEDSKKAMRSQASQKQKIFDSLFEMLVVSAPFDFESQGAQVLQDLLKGDAVAKARFDARMSVQNLSCEQKLLQSSIVEFRCDDSKKASSPEGDAACIQTFNYDVCIDLQKSSKR